MPNRSRPKRKLNQTKLAFPNSHGGRRAGAGRKRAAPRPLVTRHGRPRLAARYPVHVTVRLRAGLPSLRRLGPLEVLKRRFEAGCDRFGFRLIEYSIQSNHIHFIAEAKDARALTRGMQGLAVRIARGLNKHWDRTGKLFADRYHSRILRTPTEVRRALAYVLGNARRHRVPVAKGQADLFSSGPWFSGWRNLVPISLSSGFACPLIAAHTWLLRTGWRRLGLLAVDHIPGT